MAGGMATLTHVTQHPRTHGALADGDAMVFRPGPDIAAALAAGRAARRAGAARAGCSTCSSSRHGTCSVIGATLIPRPHHQGQTRDLPDVLARPGTACWRHERIHCESRSQQAGQVPSTVPSGRGLDAGRCRRGRARRRGQAVPEETRLHLTSYRHACSRRRDDYGESRKGIDRY
jgi:hypothetical protein